MTYYELASNLFLQLAIIILVCRLMVFVGKRYLGQTEVVCEMLAGLVLGPSVFGLFFPQIQQLIFPAAKHLLADGTFIPNQSMTLLFVLSQIGVVLYMFLTGLEFTTSIIRKHIKSVAFICFAGIALPFLMGVIFIILIDKTNLIPADVPISVAMIYFGAAISITAFPVLARIMDEKKITKTPLGTLALASGSLEDAAAWAMVALVLTISNHEPSTIFLMVGGTIAYVTFMVFFGKTLRKRFSNHFHEDLKPSRQAISVILIVLMFCAVAVDKIGLYSAFGAFVAGAVMPKGQFAKSLKNKFNYLTTVFLLPVFFVYTGLNTQIGLINTPQLWLMTILIILLAIISKFVICSLAARMVGTSWQNATAFGVLMNTRGLMELVILNIGLQYGIISTTLFTIMVLMTIVTTFMTSPLLTLILGKKYEKGSQNLF